MVAKGKPGRPTRLTPELSARICTRVRAGAFLKNAALLEGVSERTLHKWRQKGRNARSGLYRNFLDDVEEAREEHRDQVMHGVLATAKVVDDPKAVIPTREEVSVIKDAQGNVIGKREKVVSEPLKARLWWLEKSFPKDYSPRVGVDAKVENTGPPVRVIKQVVFGDPPADDAADEDAQDATLLTSQDAALEDP